MSKRKMPTPEIVKRPLRFTQLVSAPWQGTDGRFTYSLVALGSDGLVYRYESQYNGWVRFNMDVYAREG